MANKKTKKIIRYRRPWNVNVGMIIFALIFLYMSFSVYTYIRRDKVQFYEVREGSIVNNKDYTGLIFREESVEHAKSSGYINYYVPEGKRAAVGASVYSLDETGSLNAYLQKNASGKNTLTRENLMDLKKQLTSFSISYKDADFSSVGDMKKSLDAAVIEYMNFNTLDSLNSLEGQPGAGFQQVRADQAGIISYVIDSYEGLDPASVSASLLDQSKYKRTIIESGSLVESGAPAYKVITSDKWSLVFSLADQDLELYQGKDRLDVSFPGKNLKLSGKFSIIKGADGKSYGKLDFSQFMVEFESKRFVDFQVLFDQKEGLKIPASAVTTKEFLLVPEDYLTTGGDSQDSGFNKEAYGEKGKSVVFVSPTIYYAKDGYYYIEPGGADGLAAGDYVVKPDSSDRYQLGAKESLQGAYNINKGYAVFKQVEILDSNEEYDTVRKNMPYGLAVYDHIVLDASTVTEGELIYQ